jgi:transcriptional regulator with XRE-family HTH domain
LLRVAPEGCRPVPPTPAHLGSAIRRLRTERELTIESLASTAGIHWTYLTGIERGQRNPTWKVIASIAEGLDIDVSELARRAEAAAEGE